MSHFKVFEEYPEELFVLRRGFKKRRRW